MYLVLTRAGERDLASQFSGAFNPEEETERSDLLLLMDKLDGGGKEDEGVDVRLAVEIDDEILADIMRTDDEGR